MGYLLTQASDIRCPHNGAIKHYPNNPKIYIENSPICLRNDKFEIDCPIIGKNCCKRIEWTKASATRFVDSVPVLIHTSIGTCFDSESSPNGRAEIRSCQNQVTDD